MTPAGQSLTRRFGANTDLMNVYAKWKGPDVSGPFCIRLGICYHLTNMWMFDFLYYGQISQKESVNILAQQRTAVDGKGLAGDVA